MLNGIGGRTVAEAKTRVSFHEFRSWVAYQNSRGSLNQGMRIDRAVGRAAAFFGNSMSKGKRLTAVDFSPYDAEPEDDGDCSIQEAFAFLTSRAVKNDG